jgi:hypothetical protein
LVGSVSVQDALPDYTLDRSEELIRHIRSPVNLGGARQRRRVVARVAEALAAISGPKSTPATIGSSASSAILERVDMFRHFEHV